MDIERLWLPIVVAVSAAPAFVVAGMVGRGALHLVNGLDPRRVRDPDALQRRLSRLLAAIGFAIVAGAAGLLWADGERDRVLAVVVAMVVAVNGLGLALVVAVARARGDGRPRR